MIDCAKLRFLIRSLDLKGSEVAEACGIQRAFLSNICAGRYRPSFGVAQRLEEFLKQTWAERKGETVPPEVQQIVFSILYPPAPFNPFDGPRKPGRPSTRKNAAAPGMPGLESSQSI